MFGFFNRSGKETQNIAQALYKKAVEHARTPYFYSHWNVPDTVDGRFDLISLHVFLIMNAINADEKRAAKISQKLFDVMFKDMDRASREMGVGDLAVPKHMKRMMKGFHGRCTIYRQMLADKAGLAEALKRNVYGTVPDIDKAHVMALAAYVQDSAAHLALQQDDMLSSGEVRFLKVEDRYDS